MSSKISLRRVGVGLTWALLVLGSVLLIASGQALHVAAAAGGYIQASMDVLAGEYELHITSINVSGRRPWPAGWLTEVGLETSVRYYDCLTRSPCASFHRAYDAVVRKAINRKFGYDIFAELQNLSPSYVSIVIQHK